MSSQFDTPPRRSSRHARRGTGPVAALVVCSLVWAVGCMPGSLPRLQNIPLADQHSDRGADQIADREPSGTLSVTVRWPSATGQGTQGYRAQLLPDSAARVDITVRAGSSIAGFGSVTRAAGQASVTRQIKVKAGAGYAVEVKAYPPPPFGGTAIALGSASGVEITAGGSTPTAITLSSLFVPAVSVVGSVFTNSMVTITGANFQPGYLGAAKPVVAFAKSGGGITLVPASDVTVHSDTQITVRVPANVASGELVIAHDGVSSAGFAYIAAAGPIEIAATKGIKYLMDDGYAMVASNRCVSCHNTGPALRAAAFAEANPLLQPTNFRAQFDGMIDQAHQQQYSSSDTYYDGAITHVGSAGSFQLHPVTTTGWIAFSLAAVPDDTASHFDRTRFLRAAAFLRRRQGGNGALTVDHGSDPVNLSNAVQPTSQAVVAWVRAKVLDPGNASTYQTAIDNAVAYLRTESSTLQSNTSAAQWVPRAYWTVEGLQRGGVSRADTAISELIRLFKLKQRSDGGWNYQGNTTSASEAFGTGLALCALQASGEVNSPAYPAYQRAVDWLVANQLSNGSWGTYPVSDVSTAIWGTVCMAGFADP